MAVNQLKAGAALNYVIIFLRTLTGLIYTPFMLRCLGQNEYGIYSLVASVIAYLTILDFGFGNAIVRYTAKFRAEDNHEEQWKMFGMFLVIYSIIGIIAFIGGLCLYFNVDRLFDATMTPADLSQARVMMLLLTINLAMTFPLSIFGSIICAYERFVFQRIVSILNIIISTIVLIVVLLLGYKAIALVVVHTVFNLIVLGINALYCKYKLKIHIKFAKFNMPFFKEVCVYSFWIFLNVIMDKIYWGTGQFVLGVTCGTVAVAIFSVAIMLQQMYMTFSTAIGGVLLPRITTMVSRNMSTKEISNIFIKTGRLQNIVISLTLSGFMVFGRGFIRIWAGDDYDLSYIITLIFFVTLYIPLIQNTGITILQARNQMKFRSCVYVVIAIVSLALQIILSKIYGPVGCAIAIGGALLLGQGLVMNIYYSKSQKLDISQFWIEIIRMSIFPVILTVVGILSGQVVDFSKPLNLIMGIILFVIIYAAGMWLFSMNSYEKDLIGAPVKRLVKRYAEEK